MKAKDTIWGVLLELQRHDELRVVSKACNNDHLTLTPACGLGVGLPSSSMRPRLCHDLAIYYTPFGEPLIAPGPS